MMYMFFDNGMPVAAYDRPSVDDAISVFIRFQRKTWEECVKDGIEVALEDSVPLERWQDIYQTIHRKPPTSFEVNLVPNYLPETLVQELAAVKNARDYYLSSHNG